MEGESELRVLFPVKAMHAHRENTGEQTEEWLYR